jgi:hypothetical protein
MLDQVARMTPKVAAVLDARRAYLNLEAAFGEQKGREIWAGFLWRGPGPRRGPRHPDIDVFLLAELDKERSRTPPEHWRSLPRALGTRLYEMDRRKYGNSADAVRMRINRASKRRDNERQQSSRSAGGLGMRPASGDVPCGMQPVLTWDMAPPLPTTASSRTCIAAPASGPSAPRSARDGSLRDA